MRESYVDAIADASDILVQTILADEEGLCGRIRLSDSLIRDLLREIGRLVFAALVLHVVEQVTADAKYPGMTPYRSRVIRYYSLFGPIQVASPYLYNRQTRQSIRPAQDVLGIRDRGRTITLDRALSDFGIEESYGQAAKRFEEHYGWSVDRGLVRRVTQAAAVEAQEWEEARLKAEETAFSESLDTRPGVDQMLAEMDGCEIRTGTLSPSPEVGNTDTRNLPRRQREERWRDVRIGMIRPLDQEEATYVGGMDSYEKVGRRLFRAGVSVGLSSRTETICIADGANGLMEELMAQFPNVMFILDRPHLVKHVYETAEAMGLVDETRTHWAKRLMERIDCGEVDHLIREMREYRGLGHDRARQLTGYIRRFRDCVDYDAYQARGLPIGSGEVESAHRWIPQKRLKIAGACWAPDSINPMLALRLIRANDCWEEFWQKKQAA